MESLLLLTKSIADETRLRIINLLMKGELCICQIQGALQMSQPRISRHIRILKEAGLLCSRKEAQMTFYSLKTKGFEDLYKFLNKRFIKDKELKTERNSIKKIPFCKLIKNN